MDYKRVHSIFKPSASIEATIAFFTLARKKVITNNPYIQCVLFDQLKEHKNMDVQDVRKQLSIMYSNVLQPLYSIIFLQVIVAFLLSISIH